MNKEETKALLDAKQTSDLVEDKLAQVMKILGEVQELQPSTPIVFYAMGQRKYLSRCGMDIIQLGMLTEIQAVITLPSARNFHAATAERNKSAIVKPTGPIPLRPR